SNSCEGQEAALIAWIAFVFVLMILSRAARSAAASGGLRPLTRSSPRTSQHPSDQGRAAPPLRIYSPNVAFGIMPQFTPGASHDHRRESPVLRRLRHPGRLAHLDRA